MISTILQACFHLGSPTAGDTYIHMASKKYMLCSPDTYLSYLLMYRFYSCWITKEFSSICISCSSCFTFIV
jgi:hypothetical protein